MKKIVSTVRSGDKMYRLQHTFFGTVILVFLLQFNILNAASNPAMPAIISYLLSDTSFPDAVMHDVNFTSEHFSGSHNCAQCHDGIKDQSNNKDVSLVKAWESSMMANGAIDPLWRAKVASEIKRNPQHKATIEEKCSRCHTPMATVEADFATETVSLFGDGFFNHSNPHYNSAMNAISCTLCHQIENTPELGTEAGFSGHFTIADNASNARKSYGQYTNPKEGPMKSSVEFTPAHSAHMDDSKLCATCHNLKTPVIDMQGEISENTFPEQAVYTEWENSDFNTTQSCQSCHMPKTEGSVIISTRGQTGARSPFYQHQFIGANTYMLDIIKNNRTLLGAMADKDSFDRTISDTKTMLLAAADVNITQESFAEDTLNFTVKVKNHSGHKFPTSYPSRRAWLHVKVLNSENKTVFESGAFTSKGQIVGVDDKTSVLGYEQHHTKITDASQVQIYETIMADMDNNLTYTLMHASQYLKDNRILPNGFNKMTAPNSVKPYGLAVNDSDFTGGRDTVEYEIDNLPSSSMYTIIVTLKYQTLTYGFAKDLYKDIDLKEVVLMKALDDKATIRSESVSSDTVSITLP